jgi:hypothetical protein
MESSTIFDWDLIEKEILGITLKEGNHIIWNDNRQNQDGPPFKKINGIQRYIHHWLYICSTKSDPFIKLRMRRLCDHKKCINLEHWININDKDAIYKIASRNLMKNSIQEGNCRLWIGEKDAAGYGRTTIYNKHYRSHVLSMLISKKITKIPDNLIVRHKCSNKNCIAIEHLELGTHKENEQDKIRDGTALFGSKNPSATINEEIALKIYQSKNSGKTQFERAQIFGVSESIVSQIDSGHTWSQITGHKKVERKRTKIKIDENTSIQIFVDAQQRILNSIDKIYNEDMKSDDWIWLKSKDKDGYGQCYFAGTNIGAHRVSWMAFNKKPIPNGLMILHRCKQHRDCVNPDHLYIGNAKENMEDKKKH